jgi:high-affinity iron transporter
VLLFRWGVKINLRRFFQVMGVLLLLIVSGLVISALKEFEVAASTLSTLDPRWAGLCVAHTASTSSSCLLGPLVWDGSGFLPDRQFPGILLKTLLGYRDHLYLVQVLAYGLFLTIMGGLYFRSLTEPTPPALVSKTRSS